VKTLWSSESNVKQKKSFPSQEVYAFGIWILWTWRVYYFFLRKRTFEKIFKQKIWVKSIWVVGKIQDAKSSQMNCQKKQIIVF